MTDNARAQWHKAFSEAQQNLPAIHKTQTADTGKFSYSYADLNTILSLVLPVLNARDLSVAQSTVVGDLGVGVETRIYHTGGHVETFGPLFLPADRTAQSAGSAITYARRYSLLAALGLAPDEDDDGASANTKNTRVGGASTPPPGKGSPPPDVPPHPAEYDDPTDMRCPDCGGEVYDNRRENDQRRSEGKKAMPDFKCIKLRDCGWKVWNDPWFFAEGTPEKVEYPLGHEPFEEQLVAFDVENE